MAITYNVVDIRGVAAEPVAEAIVFENKTVLEGYVTFEEDIKAETIFTETDATATMQAYTSGAPSSSGSLTAFDVPVTPVKIMYYQEFDPNNLRFSRFKRDMKPGAWEIFSTEFERVVIGGIYAARISADMENKYWNNALAATKTAVAALTPGTGQTSVGAAEQTLVAATTAGLFDGVITTAIYNASNSTLTAGVGGRIKVVGTTITSSNIKAEYDKVYSAAPPELLAASGKTPYFYVPHSHKQLINIFNNNVANYKDVFVIKGDVYTFYGIEIKFVPTPENVVMLSAKEHLFWCTDLKSDYNQMQIDKIALNRDDMFIKNVATIKPQIALQRYNVLYVG